MVRIFFSTPDELYISGSVQDLKATHELLNQLSTGNKTEIFIEADGTANPEPYRDALENLVARVTSGSIKVIVANKCVEVVGSQGCFECFASFFDFDEEASPGDHNHHEYYEGNNYIHPDSIPLIVGIM